MTWWLGRIFGWLMVAAVFGLMVLAYLFVWGAIAWLWRVV